jgi:hypothetical protein
VYLKQRLTHAMLVGAEEPAADGGRGRTAPADMSLRDAMQAKSEAGLARQRARAQIGDTTWHEADDNQLWSTLPTALEPLDELDLSPRGTLPSDLPDESDDDSDSDSDDDDDVDDDDDDDSDDDDDDDSGSVDFLSPPKSRSGLQRGTATPISKKRKPQTSSSVSKQRKRK